MVTPGPRIPDWLARLYPFTPGAYTTPRGARMSYVDEGPRRGEAVLLLHGNPTWSFYYRGLIRLLAPRVRCIAPDHIGMGLSDKPAHYPYTLAQRIADVEGLVDALGLTRVDLVLHDWGGAIGMGLAIRQPRRVGRVVLMNTAAFPSDRVPARISLCRTPGVGEFLVRGLNGFAEPATWMAMAHRRLTWPERRGYLFPYDSWSHRIGVYQFVRDIPLESGHPSRPTLEAIAAGLPALAQHPCLLLWGARDFCFDDSYLSRWRRLYPHARVERQPALGHYVLEDGGAPVQQLAHDFLLPSHP